MTKIEQKQNAKRKEILLKLLPVLETRTLDELSVEDICSIADISVGSFYHYFEKKSDILVALFTRTDIYMEENAFPKMKGKDHLNNIRIFATEWVKFNESDGPERSKMITSINVTDQSLRGDVRSPIKVLTEEIEAGQKNGTIRTDMTPDRIATMFMIGLRGLGLDWTRRGGSYSLTGYGKDYIELLIRAISK